MTHATSQLRRVNASGRTRRSGAILIVALMVTITLVGMVLMLCSEMRVESITAGNRSAKAQAEMIERGAEQYVMARIADTTQDVMALTEDQFAAVQVGDGYFWVVRPDYDDTNLPLFGVTDEAGKLNINAAGSTSLTALLNGDTDTAEAIRSWRTQAAGADDEFYTDYQPKHYNFESVEELLLVRNITRTMLYGDGTAGPMGVRGNFAAQPTGDQPITDAQIARGLESLVTIYTKEPTYAPDGSSLAPFNSLSSILTSKLSLSSSQARSLIQSFGPTGPRDLFNLYNNNGGVLKEGDLDKIADYVGTPQGTQNRRVNLVTAPPAVLYALAYTRNLQPSDIDNLLAERQSVRPVQGQIEWAARVLKGRGSQLGQIFTCRSWMYSADIVAVSGNGRSFSRCRIVVDATGVPAGAPPQIVYRRDLSDRGWPMDPQILASLRSGQGINNSVIENSTTGGGLNNGGMRSLGGTRG